MVGPKAAAKWMSILDSGSLVDSRAVSDFSDGQTVALPFFLRLHTNNSDTHNEYTLTPINKAIEGRVNRCKKEENTLMDANPHLFCCFYSASVSLSLEE